MLKGRAAVACRDQGRTSQLGQMKGGNLAHATSSAARDAPRPDDASAGTSASHLALMAVLTMFMMTSLRLVAPFAYHATDTFGLPELAFIGPAAAAIAIIAWRARPPSKIGGGCIR
jgi:hypothetical protein